MKTINTKLLTLLMTIGLGALLVLPSITSAASLSLGGSTHNIGDTFIVDVFANGDGEVISTASGTVTSNANLSILSVAAGNCTPVINGLNFSCSVSGGATSFKAAVVTVKAVSAGTGTITITGAKFVKPDYTRPVVQSGGSANFTIPAPAVVVTPPSTGGGTTTTTTPASTSAAARATTTSGQVATTATPQASTATTPEGEVVAVSNPAATDDKEAVKGAATVKNTNPLTDNKFLGLALWIWLVALTAFAGACGYAYYRYMQLHPSK